MQHILFVVELKQLTEIYLATVLMINKKKKTHIGSSF